MCREYELYWSPTNLNLNFGGYLVRSHFAAVSWIDSRIPLQRWWFQMWITCKTFLFTCWTAKKVRLIAKLDFEIVQFSVFFIVWATYGNFLKFLDYISISNFIFVASFILLKFANLWVIEPCNKYPLTISGKSVSGKPRCRTTHG